jgi:putative ABC transport system substrate-binding protein
MNTSRSISILSMTVLCALLIAGAYFFTYRSSRAVANKKVIAVLYPYDFVAAERMCLGIQEASTSGLYARHVIVRTFGFDVYDKMRVLATVETVLEQKPAVILAIGGTVTLALKETMAKRGIHIPVVFAGVTVAVEWGLVESYEHPGGLMTGVDSIDELGVDIQSKLICITKPTVQKVLIPYIASTDPRDMRSELIAASIKEYLETRGIQVTVVALSGASNILDTVAELLPGHDMLCSLEIDGLSQLSAGFSKLCSQAGVTFFCGGLNGTTFDAAISFGIDPKPIGATLFSMASEIVFDGKNPADMPVVVLTVCRDLYINLLTAPSQGYWPDFGQIVRDLVADPETASIVQRLHIVNT